MKRRLKAELIRKGWKLERTHNIRRLLAIAEDYNICVELEDEDIDLIDSIYRSRYPAEEGLLPMSTPLDCLIQLGLLGGNE